MTSTTPTWSALRKKEQRRHRRYTVENSTLRVSWLGINGEPKMATHARVLNVSESGMAVELPEAPMPNTMIRFQSERYKLVGSGSIKHFRKVAHKFVVGLEFNDGLRWLPPPDDVKEPIPLFPPLS
ncbi:MAG: PilZ domain-containing protein [Acidobacteria bacterium]|nr:PilZ domain-containing protein [Acidobacteriota bacterium]MBI3474019.1 PilZ domain-containing protein [Candidatus Solibacter usitatus]